MSSDQYQLMEIIKDKVRKIETLKKQNELLNEQNKLLKGALGVNEKEITIVKEGKTTIIRDENNNIIKKIKQFDPKEFE